MESAESEQLQHAYQAVPYRDEPEGQQQDLDLPGAQGYANAAGSRDNLNHGNIQDRHEPVRQWVLNIDPNPHPEDDQIFDVSFSSDQGERPYGLGLLQGSMQRPGISNSNPDLRTGIRQNSRQNGAAIGVGYLMQGQVEGHREDHQYGNQGEGHRENQENLSRGIQTERMARVEPSVDEDQSMFGLTNRESPVESYQEVANTEPAAATAGNPVENHEQMVSDSNTRDSEETEIGIGQLDSLGKNHLVDSSRQTIDSGIGGSQVFTTQKSDSTRNGNIASPSNPPSTVGGKSKANRHENCVVPGLSVRPTQGAIPKQRSSSLPRPHGITSQRARADGAGGQTRDTTHTHRPGEQKAKPKSSQASRTSNTQKAGAEGSSRQTASSSMNPPRGAATARGGGSGGFRQTQGKSGQRVGQGQSIKGERPQNKETGRKDSGAPSIRKHLAAQGVDLSPIRPEGETKKTLTPKKGEEPPGVNQNVSVNHSKPYGSSKVSDRNDDGVQNSSWLPGQRSQPQQQRLESVHQLLQGQNLHESTHTGSPTRHSVGSSEAMTDYMMDVNQHLQSILQSGHQSTGHGHQSTGHGHQPTGHGHQPTEYVHQPTGQGHQHTGHGHQPTGHGYQSQLTGHLMSHMMSHQASSPGNRHSFYSDGVSGNLDQLLAYSSKYLTGTEASVVPSTHRPQAGGGPLEMHLLREALEKEQLRRKHCEQLIQELQRKLLESQEQLTVAVEMDRKKDHVIQQLDKSLGSVVEKWKQSDGERQHKMELLQKDHLELQKVHIGQTETLAQFESDLKETVERLSSEREKAQQTDRQQQDQLRLKTQELQACSQELALHRERSDTLSNECSGLAERLDRLHTQFAELKEVYDEESLLWGRKEKEYSEELQQLKENQQEEIQRVEGELSEKLQCLDRMETELGKTRKHTQELELELDTLARERESLKVQLGLQEARLESAQRRLEAELAQKYQQQTQQEVSAVKAEMVAMETKLQERHREQMGELGRRQQQELSTQMAALRADVEAREERYREQEQAFRQTINGLQSELEDQRETNRVLDNQQSELASKLPAMMRAHCDQALKLLWRGGQGNVVSQESLSNDQRQVVGASNPSVTMTTSSVTYSSGSVLTSSAHSATADTSTTLSRSLAGEEFMSRSVVGQADIDQGRFNPGQFTLSTVQDVANSSLFSSLSEDQTLNSMLLGSGTSPHRRGSSTNRIVDGNAFPEPRGIPVGSVLPSNTVVSTSSASATSSHSNSPHLHRQPVIASSHSIQDPRSQNTLVTSSFNYRTALNDNSVSTHDGGVLLSGYAVNTTEVSSSDGYHSHNDVVPQPPGLQLRPVQYESEKRQPGGANTSAVVSFKDRSGERSVVYEPARMMVSSNNQTPGASQNPGARADQRVLVGSSDVTPTTLFHNLSAQNHQGMEFIRQQLEQQTTQILLHPPASLDLSALQGPEEEEVSTQSALQSASQSISHNSGGSHHTSGSSGSVNKVTWREGDDSFLSAQTETTPQNNRSGMDYSDMGEKFNQHEERQQELQRYIKMLLHKPPGNSADVSLASDTQTPRTENQASPPPESSVDPLRVGTAGLSLGDVTEISCLLGMYRQTESSGQEMQDVISYLRETHDNRFEQPVQPSPPSVSPTRPEYPPSPRKQPTAKVRRNLESTYKLNQQESEVKPEPTVSAGERLRQSNVPALTRNQQSASSLSTKSTVTHIQAVRPMSQQQRATATTVPQPAAGQPAQPQPSTKPIIGGTVTKPTTNQPKAGGAQKTMNTVTSSKTGGVSATKTNASHHGGRIPGSSVHGGRPQKTPQSAGGQGGAGRGPGGTAVKKATGKGVWK